MKIGGFFFQGRGFKKGDLSLSPNPEVAIAWNVEGRGIRFSVAGGKGSPYPFCIESFPVDPGLKFPVLRDENDLLFTGRSFDGIGPEPVDPESQDFKGSILSTGIKDQPLYFSIITDMGVDFVPFNPMGILPEGSFHIDDLGMRNDRTFKECIRIIYPGKITVNFYPVLEGGFLCQDEGIYVIIPCEIILYIQSLFKTEGRRIRPKHDSRRCCQKF